MFVQIGKGERLTTCRLTDQAVYFVLREGGEPAGVQTFSPHGLRRTFISGVGLALLSVAVSGRFSFRCRRSKSYFDLHPRVG